jgi:hypothetical protein
MPFYFPFLLLLLKFQSELRLTKRFGVTQNSLNYFVSAVTTASAATGVPAVISTI